MSSSIKEIVEYWSDNADESGLGVGWAEAHERCWRCGYKKKLEPHPIVPKPLGGEEGPSNFVLLCHRCQKEAPNHTNPDYMWTWLRATSVPLYDTYWLIRGAEAYEKMFGRKPFVDLDGEQSSMDLVKDKMKQAFDETVERFGEGGLNPATIACIIAELEQALEAPKVSE